MAYVNVAEWSPDQVTDWLKGLDNAIYPYIPCFLNNGVGGRSLLHFRPDELELLGMTILGHQEIILEAVGHLRNFHYELDRENLQHLALRLSTAATSLHRELSYHPDGNKLDTRVLSNVANTISTIKPLACWLDRSPFSGQLEYSDRRSQLLALAIEMATSGQRDRFAEQPVAEIRHMAQQLARLADEIIQDIVDPMLLQPASLDLATLKKRESDLGFCILPSYHGALQIADIKLGSPAHSSGKIEEGDEIVQVNYQTVVGWQRKKVLMLFEESPPDVLLTLKKRPRHTKIYGQIYMKPYRLPSKKRALPYNRWHDNLPSPRPELLTIPDFEMPLPKPAKPVPEPILDSTDSSDDSDISVGPLDSLVSVGASSMADTLRLYLPKPRSVLQRRNTISGSSPITKRPNFNMDQFWRELKDQKSVKRSGSSYMEGHNPEPDLLDGLSLRDKSVSYGYGLELAPRPNTCLGVNLHGKLIRNDSNKSEKDIITSELKSFSENKSHIDSHVEAKTNKSVRFETDNIVDIVNIDGKLLSTNEAIPYVDDEDTDNCKNTSGMLLELPSAIGNDNHKNNNQKERGKLDKSHSTPAYDFESGEKDNNLKSEVATLESPNSLTEYVCKDVKTVKVTDDGTDDAVIETINAVLVEQITKNEIQNATIKTLNQGVHHSEYKPAIEPRNVHPMMPPVPPPRPKATLKPVVPQRKFVESTSIRDTKPSQDILQKSTAMSEAHEAMHLSTRTSPTRVAMDFEPKVISTPMLSNENKSGEKISPGSLAVRSILSTKSRSLKKKNSLLAKRRNVSVKALVSASPGPSMQGWLYQRDRTSTNKTPAGVKWECRWFVLNDSTLYGFRSSEATKACCMLFLGGYTVGVASEVKSRPLAFKVYHTGTFFYFSAHTAEELALWLQHISQATLIGDSHDSKSQSALYSETDTSGDEKDTANSSKKSKSESKSSSKMDLQSSGKSNSSEKQTKNDKTHNLKFGSLKKFARNKTDSDNTHSSTSLDRKYLRFFSSSKNNSDKNKVAEKNISKTNHDVPVPTAQYRSYRKIPPNSPVSVNEIIHKIEVQPVVNAELKPNLSEAGNQNFVKTKKFPKPINYIHASNPNLIDFDSSDFTKTSSFRNNNIKCTPPRPENLIGFVTLEQFMLNKQKEEMTEVYSNRVLCGMERDKLKESIIGNNKLYKDKMQRQDDDIQKQLRNIIPDVIYGELNQIDSHTMPRKMSDVQIQNRSLPKTPEHQDLESDNFKSLPKKLSRGFNDGYELIYGESGASRAKTKTSNVDAGTKSNSDSKIPVCTEPRKLSLDSKLASRRISSDSNSTNSSASDGNRNKTENSKMSGKTINLSLNRQQSLNGVKKNGRHSADKLQMSEVTERKYGLNPRSPTIFNRGDSPEKFWIDSLRRNDKVYAKSNDVKVYGKTNEVTLKSAAQYTPMNLPLNKINNKFTFDISLEKNDTTHTSQSSMTKFRNMFHKSSHDNNSNRSKNITSTRTIGTPKQTYGDKGVKERTILGSPRLHRALFGKNEHNNWGDVNKAGTFNNVDVSTGWQNSSNYTESVFTSNPIGYNNGNSNNLPSLTMTPPQSSFSSNVSSNIRTPDYPNLEYPPVFEAETYSLADPNTSLTLLRKRNNN